MVDSNLTIESRYYTDPSYYRIEKEKILYRTWQFACHETDLAEPGAFRTLQIADESIVIVRGRDQEIRAFYNVCRHRAHRIVEGVGHCSRLVCPYHAWSYNLDGSLAQARGTEQVPDFDPGEIRLKPVRLENFCGLVFVNLDEKAAGLDRLYPGLREEILSTKPALPAMVRLHEDRIRHESNWKVSVENFSECYHCPVAHKFITSTLYSGDSYRISIGDGIVRHFAPRLKERDIHGDLHIWFLWPNLAIEIFPMHHSLSIRQFEAVGPRQTDYLYLWYGDPGLTESQREALIDLGRTYHVTNGIEDQDIVRYVQLGLESRSYDRGQLVLTAEPSAESEHAVAFFQERYLAAMGEI